MLPFSVNTSPSPHSDTRRIALLLLLFVGVVAGMSYVHRIYSGPQQTAVDPSKQEYQYSDGVEHPLAQVRPSSALYHTVENDIIDLERARNPETLAALSNTLLPIMEWVAGRKQQVAAAPEGQVTVDVIPRSVWNYEKILQEPSRWRWRDMHVYGRVMRYYMTEYPEYPEGLRRLFFVVLQDEYEKNYFTVLTPALPKNIVPADPEGYVMYTNTTNGLVAFDGMFLLDFPYHISDSGRVKDETPLFFAEKVYLAVEGRQPGMRLDENDDPGGCREIAPLKTVPGLDINFLRNKLYVPAGRVTDSGEEKVTHLDLEIASDLRSEKTALDHVFEYLWAKDPKMLAREAQNPAMNYVNLMSQPTGNAWMMGKAANFYGVALSLQILRFPEDQGFVDNGISRWYLLTAGDARYRNAGRFTWTLGALNLPPNLRRGDWIAADGVYCKLFPYKTANGGLWQWSPLLLCKTIRKVPPPPPPLMPAWLPEWCLVWLGGGLVLATGALGWYIHYANRRDATVLERIVKRSRSRSLPPCKK